MPKKTDNALPSWADDMGIEEEKLDKAIEILPKYELPSPGDDPIILVIDSEPEKIDFVDKKTGEEKSRFVCRVTILPRMIHRSISWSKSLGFNAIKQLVQAGFPKNEPLTGKTFKVWAEEEDGTGFTMYQCELFNKADLDDFTANMESGKELGGQ